jgi:hypothetical protein
MRKAPKRGHRVMNRTSKQAGSSSFHGLLAVDLPPHIPFLESPGANAVCAIDGFRALFPYTLPSYLPAHFTWAGLGHSLLIVLLGPPGPSLRKTILFQTRTKRQSLVGAHRQSRWLTELQFARSGRVTLPRSSTLRPRPRRERLCETKPICPAGPGGTGPGGRGTWGVVQTNPIPGGARWPSLVPPPPPASALVGSGFDLSGAKGYFGAG